MVIFIFKAINKKLKDLVKKTHSTQRGLQACRT